MYVRTVPSNLLNVLRENVLPVEKLEDVDPTDKFSDEIGAFVC